MKIIIIAAKFAKPNGGLEIGGIETYILQLTEALYSAGEIVIYQPSTNNFDISLDRARVVGRNADLQTIINRDIHPNLKEGDIVIVSSEQLNVVCPWKRTIVIQHGIYWDLPALLYSQNFLAKRFPVLYKLWDGYRNIKRMKDFNHIVCVDYIYQSWFKSFWEDSSNRTFTVIPNHAADDFFSIETKSNEQTVHVLFARRFMRFRGTQEFCQASKQLLARHDQLRVTICGAGPDENSMKEILPPSDRVTYRTASYREMPKLVAEHDIIVVPSLGSEGSSLSAIEGMAAGRAVIATAVGGLTNVLIDGYNGLLIEPGSTAALAKALDQLIQNEALRNILGKRAREISQASFSFEKWAYSWRTVIEEVQSCNQ